MIKISDRYPIQIIYERGNRAAGALPSEAGKDSWDRL
jgi:hypothetical protein